MSRWTCSSEHQTSPGRNDCGAALPGVLVLAAVMVGVSGWIVGHLRLEAALAFELEEAHVVSRVAEAALQSAASAVGLVPDWTSVSSLGMVLPCPASTTPTVVIDEAAERAWLQAETDAASRWGGDAPVWQLLWTCHGPGVLERWPHRQQSPSVIVWVADEPEGDNRPDQDTNQRLLLTAVARGRGGIRGLARAAITRTSPGASVRVLAWHGESDR